MTATLRLMIALDGGAKECDLMRGDAMRDKLSVLQLPLLGGRCERKKTRVGIEPRTIAKASTCSAAGRFVVLGPPADMGGESAMLCYYFYIGER